MLRNQNNFTKARPHYRLQKTTLGVASVLLGTTLYCDVVAHADTVTSNSAGQPAPTTEVSKSVPATTGSTASLAPAPADGIDKNDGNSDKTMPASDTNNAKNSDKTMPASDTNNRDDAQVLASQAPSQHYEAAVSLVSVNTGNGTQSVNDEQATEKTLTRTINITDPQGKQTQQTQMVKYTRQDTNSSWSTNHNQFDSYQLPQVAGYIPYDLDGGSAVVDGKVGVVKTTPNMGDLVVNVGYRKDVSSTTIQFVTDAGDVVGSTTATGQTGDKKPINLQIPDGFTLNAGQVLPTMVVLHGKVIEQMEVTPIKVEVNANDPKTTFDVIPGTNDLHFPSGVDQDALNRTITRKIQITNVDGTVTTETQPTVTFIRNATVTAYNGHIEYGPWNKATQVIPAFELPENDDGVPVVEGSLDAWTVDPDTVSSLVKVRYVAADTSQQVIFSVDGTVDGEVDEANVDGVVGQTVAVHLNVPAGYVLKSGEKLPTTIKMTNSDPDPLIISVDEQHVTVTADHPKTMDDIVPDTDEMYNYPDGVARDDLNKDVSRTIELTMPDGKTTTKTQTAHLTRNADVDVITGDVAYQPWTKGAWDEYLVPEVKGYAPSQSKVDQVTVTDTTKSATVKISYAPVGHMTVVEYVDVNGNPIATKTLTGKTGETVDTGITIPNGWQLVNGQKTIPGQITMGVDGHAKVTSTIEHIVTDVSANDPLTRLTAKSGKPVYAKNEHDLNPVMSWGTIDQATGNVTITPDGGQTYPTGYYAIPASQADLNQTVVREIRVHGLDGQVKTTTQTAVLHRNAKLDEVTGEVTYGPWSTGSWDEFNTPEIAGYHTNMPYLQAVLIEHGNPSERYDINYYPNDQAVKVVYQDGNQTVKTITLTGKTGTQTPIHLEVPEHYHVEGQVPTEYTFKANNSDIVINLTHDTQSANEHRDVVRTIKVTTPDGQTTTTTQTVTLKRTGTTDLVTGKTSWNAWTIGTWEAFNPAKVDGYNSTMKKVKAQKVTDATQNSEINISYTATAHAFNIVYKDGKQVIKTVPMSGKTGEEVKLNYDGVPEHYHIVGEMPGTYKVHALLNSDVIVNLSHDTTKVDGHRLIMRDIEITNPDGTTKLIKQDAELLRHGVKDLVTGQIDWQPWSTGQWDAFETPQIIGYTSSVDGLKAQTVTIETQPVSVQIAYTANEQSVEIVYQDNGKIVKCDKLTGKTADTVPVKLDVPKGYHVAKAPAKTYIFKGEGNANVIVELGHNTEVVHDSRTISRTIDVTMPDRTIKTTKQDVTLTRQGTKDVVTGNINWQAWTTGDWKSFDVPTISGYTPSQKTVKSQDVDINTEAQTVKITYTANEQSTQMIYQDDHGKTIKSTPLTGHTDETVPVKIDLPAGYHLVGDVAKDYTFNGNDNQPVVIKIAKDNVPIIHQDHQGSEMTSQGVSPVSQVNSSTISVKSSKSLNGSPMNAQLGSQSKTLPQTGDDQNAKIAGLLGVALAVLGTAFGFLSTKHKHIDD